MWICIKAKNGDIDIVSYKETETEILNAMHNELVTEWGSEDKLNEAIRNHDAEEKVNGNKYRAWSFYGCEDTSWKCIELNKN